MTDLNQLDDASAEEVLRAALDEYGNKVALASSFGAEDVVLIDMLHKINPKAKIFTLDTGRLNQETYDVMDAAREKYGMTFDIYHPDTDKVEKMSEEHGFNLFYDSIEKRKLCCGVRKMDGIKRALSGLDAWITGLRAEQSVTRVDMKKMERDEGNNMMKFNPLMDWTEGDIWNYIRENDVPYNALHDQGFPSIGCEPCTRAVRKIEDFRAGRWWWENPEQKECGLHVKEAVKTGS